MIYPWQHNRRFNSYPEYFKKIFGERIQKLSLDAGFSCPNRDGKVGKGGCTFCNNDAFNPSYCLPEKSITQQIQEGIEFHQSRYKAKKYLAYFQAFSNTYAPLSILKKKYEEALRYPDVIGLIIGTRPDCIDEEKLAYISKLSKKYYVAIEYGIESCYDETLKAINRGHTFVESKKTLELTAKYNIRTGAHFIFGLPGESREKMLHQVEIISKLPLTTIKFHQLQIIKKTQMAKDYDSHPSKYQLFSLDEYINFIIRFTEKLNPAFVIERFAGESPPRYILNKQWGPRNDQILNLIEKEMALQDTWQGKFYK